LNRTALAVAGFLDLFGIRRSSQSVRIDVSVALGRFDVTPLPLNCSVDVTGFDCAFLRTPMSHNRFAAMKEVQQPIIDPLPAHSQFVYPLAQEVRFRPAKLMPGLFKAPDPVKKLIARIVGDLVQPL